MLTKTEEWHSHVGIEGNVWASFSVPRLHMEVQFSFVTIVSVSMKINLKFSDYFSHLFWNFINYL